MKYYLDFLREMERLDKTPLSKDNFRLKTLGNIYLPKDMFPSRAIYEKLGFTFWNIPNDFDFNGARLPNGWFLKENDGFRLNRISDCQTNVLIIDMYDYSGELAGRIYYFEGSCRIELTEKYIKSHNLDITTPDVAPKVKKLSDIKTAIFRQWNHLMYPRTEEMEK
ncbi:MAG: hypothetical protein PHE54_03295 [Bacilli bacterium]|nr:hypothetical protein [Bacilli bacterium]